ncbi:MAG: hypothetical protein RL033_2205 [Pseudomonadota bacterium]
MEEVVGAGAMGVVVRAWHIELEQSVAVKFLYPEFARNADGSERFRREARAAAKIKNQHVTRVLDVGALEGKNIPYIVMEYLEGHDLSREIRERGPVPVALAVRYVMQACEAVAEAHERGIVHRDLKPANLFVAEGTHGERMIKVLDFGISKVNGTGGAQQFSLTDTATLMGSPAYMSPEQLESSRNVDGRADIWSLGVILHEMIMGQVPFTGESVPQLVRSILSGTRNSLVERDPALDRLEAVVARCLCQERDQRYETITDLQDALRPFASLMLSGDPSLSMMASRQVPIPLVHETSGSPSVVVSMGGIMAGRSTAGAAVPARQSQVSNGAHGSNGVPSAWGNTQRGRQRSWQRHGLPLALLLALMGLGAYWVSGQVSSSVSSDPVQGQLANTPASSRPTSTAHAGQPIAAPTLPSLSAQVPAPSARPAGSGLPASGLPTSGLPGSGPSSAASPAATGEARAATNGAASDAHPAANVPPLPAASGPKVSPFVAAPVPVPPPPARAIAKPGAASRGVNTERAAAAGESAQRGLRTSDSDVSDKPKSDTSSRDIPEVPDFGGRE